MTMGGAQISEKHANFIVNIDNAKAKDVRDLIDLVKKTILEIKTVKEILFEITDELKDDVQSQIVDKQTTYLKKINKSVDSATILKDALKTVSRSWDDINERLKIVPGKCVLKNLRKIVHDMYSVNLTDFKIIDEFESTEINPDINRLIKELSDFSKTNL